MAIQRTSLNISLTPELEQFIAARVASGRYQTASEVVRAALRLLEENDSREERLSLRDSPRRRRTPLCQTSCRLHRIWPMGALDEGTWLDTVNTSKSG